ncbi:hypothetical protein V1477_021104, partial [Vespula maculifrons]
GAINKAKQKRYLQYAVAKYGLLHIFYMMKMKLIIVTRPTLILISLLLGEGTLCRLKKGVTGYSFDDCTLLNEQLNVYPKSSLIYEF